MDGHIHNGVPLWEALKFMEQLRAGRPELRTVGPKSTPTVRKRASNREEAVNTQNLAELEAFLASTDFKSKRKS